MKFSVNGKFSLFNFEAKKFEFSDVRAAIWPRSNEPEVRVQIEPVMCEKLGSRCTSTNIENLKTLAQTHIRAVCNLVSNGRKP